MGYFFIIGLIVGIPMAIYLHKKTPSIACPKCSNDVKYSINTAKCPYCKTRFIIDMDKKEVKEIV